MHKTSSSARSKIIEYFRTQETSNFGNTSFLLDKLCQWLDSIEMKNELSIKQDIFSIISCLVPFNRIMSNNFYASKTFDNENNLPFFQPSHFNSILKSSFKSIKITLSQQINSAMSCSSKKDSTSIITDFFHAVLLLLEISLFHVRTSLASNSCIHANEFASQVCNVSSESVMFELKSVLLLLLGAATEYRCDCMDYLRYSSHERHRVSAVSSQVVGIDSNNNYISGTRYASNGDSGSGSSSSSSSSSSNLVYPQSLQCCGTEEHIKPFFSGSVEVEELAVCVMHLLDTCDTVLQAAVAFMHGGTSKGKKFEREVVDSMQTSLLIDLAKFWNNQGNSPAVDCLIASAMLCSLPSRSEEKTARPYIYTQVAQSAIKSELTSAGLTAVIPVAMRLADRFQPQYQILALELLFRAAENTPASIAQSFCSWIVPKIIVYLKAFTDEKSILLASRFIQMMLSTSSVRASPSTIVPLCHEYLNHSTRFFQMASLHSRWSYLTHFQMIFPWVSVGLIECHLESIMLTLLTQLNAWHYPIHVICMDIFQVLVRRVPQGLAIYSLKLTVELIRMQVFYIRGEYDVSSFFHQHADNEGDPHSTSTTSIKEEMLRATIVLAKALRRLNVRQWDETASAIIRHSRETLASSAVGIYGNYDGSGSDSGTNKENHSSSRSSSSVQAVNDILTNFYSQVQHED